MQIEQNIPASVVVRVYVLGPLEIYKREDSGTWRRVSEGQWKKSRPARSALKRLLVQPGRRLSREQLAEDVWAENESEPTGSTVYIAISLVRGVIGKHLVKLYVSAYEIAGQAVVWTDIDEVASLLKSVENHEHTSQAALPLLEQALSYLERGELLEGEYCTWCYAFRHRSEEMLRQCRLWLAEAYEKQGRLWQAGEQYRAMILTNSSDENALLCWLEMLARHGKRQEILKCYQGMKRFVETQGFLLSPEAEQAALLLSEQPGRTLLVPSQVVRGNMESQKNVPAIRRQLLQDVLGDAGNFLFSGDTLHISTDTLPLFTTLTDICRQLSEGNELNIAEHILWMYLPKIDLHARLSSDDQKSAASVASQGYLLAASLVGHRNDLLGRLHFSEQALRCGELGDDLDLRAVAVRQIAISFDCMARPDKVLETYAQVFPYLNRVSPLVRACIYADLSGAHAYLAHEKEASSFLDLAYESFPQHPEKEPSYLGTICRYSSLVFWEGVNHLSLRHPRDAENVFRGMLQPETQHPERNRIEVLNYLVETLIELGDLEQACAFLEMAVQGALAVGSVRRYQQEYALFQRMQRRWCDEKHVQRLSDLFVR